MTKIVIGERVRFVANIIWLICGLILIIVGLIEAIGCSNNSAPGIISTICGFFMFIIYMLGVLKESVNILHCVILLAFIVLIPLQITAISLSFAISYDDNELALGIINSIVLIIQFVILLTTVTPEGWARVGTTINNSLNRPFGIYDDRPYASYAYQSL